MQVIEVILPVLVMLVVGMACRKWKLLSSEGIRDLKFLVTNIMMPVAVFHAMGTADYSRSTWILVAIMLFMLAATFAIGFAMRPLMGETYRRYLPYMVSVYEAGLIGYPLYTSLCGPENLSRIAVLDIAGLLFGFSVYMGMLTQMERGEPVRVRTLAKNALRTPLFVACILGTLVGVTGLLKLVIASPVGPAYDAVKNILTTSVTAVILLVVGYSMELTKELLQPCLKTIFLRLLLQTPAVVCVLLASRFFLGRNPLSELAIIMFMATPATFSIQAFMKDERGSAYVSTTNSLYCVVSIAVYMVLAMIVY